MATTNPDALRLLRDVRRDVRPGYDRLRAAYAASDPKRIRREREARARPTTTPDTRR